MQAKIAKAFNEWPVRKNSFLNEVNKLSGLHYFCAKFIRWKYVRRTKVCTGFFSLSLLLPLPLLLPLTGPGLPCCFLSLPLSLFWPWTLFEELVPLSCEL